MSFGKKRNAVNQTNRLSFQKKSLVLILGKESSSKSVDRKNDDNNILIIPENNSEMGDNESLGEVSKNYFIELEKSGKIMGKDFNQNEKKKKQIVPKLFRQVKF